MSATWKGTLQVVLISDEPYYDAESGLKYSDRVWAGRKDAIEGFANDLEESGIGYQIGAQPPVYTVSARIPFNEPTTEVLDRYEITTEAQDKSIFEVPAIVEDALAHDSQIPIPSKSYRQYAEDFTGEPQTDSPSLIGVGAVDRFDSVVRHLRNGVTGYQIDFIVLRRFRQIDLAYGYAGGRMNLSEGLEIFSTAQLNLPSSVAFVIPATPNAIGSDYEWGWRIRGQRVELSGNYVEQTFELVFAPWSLLVYTPATSSLQW
jgi:hypothetical protein